MFLSKTVQLFKVCVFVLVRTEVAIAQPSLFSLPAGYVSCRSHSALGEVFPQLWSRWASWFPSWLQLRLAPLYFHEDVAYRSEDGPLVS